MQKHTLSVSFVVLFSLLLGAGTARGPQLGSRAAKDWIDRLDRPDRVAGMKIDQVIPRLNLKPGDMVADIGAGTGLFSLPLAQAVAPGGKLLAVEIDQDLLDHIQEKARQENIENIVTVLGKFEDPNLPTRDIDLAFFHDVLHHIEKREAYLKALAGYLKPNARIVVIDLLRGHQNEPEMQITLDRVKQWMGGAGFQLVEDVKGIFDDKFFAVFERN